MENFLDSLHPRDFFLKRMYTGPEHFFRLYFASDTGGTPSSSFPRWHVPVRRTSFFTGRQEALHQLRDALVRDGSVVLTADQHGPSAGIGKTCLAVEYASRFHEQYQAVFWLDAAQPEMLADQCRQLARVLHLSPAQSWDAAPMGDALHQWFATHTDWLLIVDDADDLAAVLPFLPSSQQGHLLFTRRTPLLATPASMVAIGPLPEEEALHFFLRRTRLLIPSISLERMTLKEREAAEKVVEACEGLPLALELAGAYVEEMGCQIATFVARFERRFALLQRRRPDLLLRYPAAVVTTISLAFNQLKKQFPLAAALLTASAFLEPQPLSLSLFAERNDMLGPSFRTARGAMNKLEEACHALEGLSLLRPLSVYTDFVLHPLVRTLIQELLSSSEYATWAERVK